MRDRLDEHACNLPWYQSSPGLPSCFISATHGLLKKKHPWRRNTRAQVRKGGGLLTSRRLASLESGSILDGQQSSSRPFQMGHREEIEHSVKESWFI
jgi:hypothetical protein